MLLTTTRRYFLLTAMVLTALMVVGQIHSHLCLDGQEPALSVHFETFNGHPDHADDAPHEDTENELVPQALLGKAPQQDAPMLLFAFALLFTYQPTSRQRHYQLCEVGSRSPPSLVLPPSQAPPASH